MKIGDISGSAIEGVTEWVVSIKNLSNPDLLDALSQLKYWE